MPLVQLKNAKAKPGVKYYLDTSALFALAAPFADADGQTVPASELQHEALLRAFFPTPSSSGDALVRTSVLTMQEIAHKTRRTYGDALAKDEKFANWQHLSRSGSAELVKAVREKANDAMLQFLEWAVQGLKTVGAEVERRAVAQSETTADARTLRKAHRKLLSKYPAIDVMDALHIAVGGEMGIKDFVSFDIGWEAVAEVTVYR